MVRFEDQILQIWRNLQEQLKLGHFTSDHTNSLESHFLLAISGGVDSMVLWEVFKRLKQLLKIEIAVGYVHHGRGEKVQEEFRNRAAEWISSQAKVQGVRFFTNHQEVNSGSHLNLKSEAQFREFRYGLLNQWKMEWSQELGQPVGIALAHHADDLLETRLIRMIRGTGLQGLQAMTLYDKGILRPLIYLNANEIRNYAHQQKIEWLEDPSNQNGDYLRNWLRNQWLPLLEQRHSGAIKNLSRSLSLIANQMREKGNKAHQLLSDLENTQGTSPVEKENSHFMISRLAFSQLSGEEKRSAWASQLQQWGFREYSQNHIDEIIKRLNTTKKKFDFVLLKRRWFVNAQQINVTKSEGE